MDYSQYQVKYIENPVFMQKEIDIPDIEPIDFGNISYMEAEADKPTSLIMQEPEQTTSPIKRVVTPKKVVRTSLPASAGLNTFNRNYDQAILESGDSASQLQSRRELFTRLAHRESGFRSGIQNSAKVPAWGYFQLMQGNYKGQYHNNIGKYAGVDIRTFLNSPVIQIKAANSLANSFLKSFSNTELNRMHKLGWSDSAIIAGCWLGGQGNVRKFVFGSKDSKDVHGTSVGQYMREFNNL